MALISLILRRRLQPLDTRAKNSLQEGRRVLHSSSNPHSTVPKAEPLPSCDNDSDVAQECVILELVKDLSGRARNHPYTKERLHGKESSYYGLKLVIVKLACLASTRDRDIYFEDKPRFPTPPVKVNVEPSTL